MGKIFPVNKKPDMGEDDLLGDAMMDVLGLDKTRTQDCIPAIMAEPAFKKTNPKNWKRRAKQKNHQGQWVRIFEDKTTGSKAEVTETKGGVVVKVIQAPAGGGFPGIINPPVAGWNGISLLPLIPPEKEDIDPSELEWTGRVVYDFADEDDDVESQLGLYIAPEEIGGFMDDTYDGGILEKLQTMFPEYVVYWMASENYHVFTVPSEINREAMKMIVMERIEAAGAVQMETPAANVDEEE
jgi:hypothetical protein